MTYQLNEEHALYPFLHELIGVKGGALVSLKTARTFTKHVDATYGTGTYGEHFKSLDGGYTGRGASISPAVALSTITHPNMTLVVVVNSVTTASNSAQFIEGTNQTPTLNAQGGKLGASDASTLVGAQGTITVTGTTPHFLSLVRVGETSYEARVDGALSASGGQLTWDNAGPTWPYIGGTPGFGSITAEFVWVAWFTKALTTQELSDLRASLGANNAFALVQAPVGDTTAPTLTSPSATPTGATTASGSVSTTEGNGTLYWLASANATELLATVKAGSSQAVTAIGAQPVTVTGLTASSPYYLHFVHTDAAANDSAVATSPQFMTDAPSGDTDPPTLTGVVTFTSVTQTSYIPNWPVGSDNVAITGYEYQIGSTAGAWTDAGNNLSAAITGRTAGATETVYVRAYDAAGLRSTPAISGSVTLLSATTDGTITVGSALYPIKYSSASVLNESGLRATVLDATTLAQVLNTSGVVCNAGVITITDAALVIGNTYHLTVKTASGWTGFSDVVTAS